VTSIEYDLGYLKEAAGSLQNYLLSPDLYWTLTASPPPGESAYPAMTLGGVILAESRLTARNLGARQAAEMQSLSLQIQAIHNRWRTAWEIKGLHSFHARLTQWGNFLEDYRNQPDSNHDRYPYEVRLRLILDLLKQTIPGIPTEQERLLDSLDRVLKSVLVGDEFVWEEDMRSGYPRADYWYLYGRLR